jgi:ABC-type nitrate/sulfonate/bicarbonate transport system substrate-binding protein
LDNAVLPPLNLPLAKGETERGSAFSRAFSIFVVALFVLATAAAGAEIKLDRLTASYPSVTGNMAPLWVAQDFRLFEKHGLDVTLVNIASGFVSINALISGDIQIAAASSSSAISAALRGHPVVIMATLGPTPYKLVAHPSITSLQELKGRTVGSSRPGSGSDFALRRFLAKAGFTPGKDVAILPTGLSESDKRVMSMLQGKMDATLATADTIANFELKGQKINVLADLLSMGIHTSGSVIAMSRRFLEAQRRQAKAFLMSFSEGIATAKRDKETAFQIYRKHLRVQDPKLLEVIYRTSVTERLPLKPYPEEEAVKFDLELLAATNADLREKILASKPSQFADASLLKELEAEGFFASPLR